MRRSPLFRGRPPAWDQSRGAEVNLLNDPDFAIIALSSRVKRNLVIGKHILIIDLL